MAMININIRAEKAVKEQAEKLFSELGLNMTTAVNMFLKTCIRKSGIPFELTIAPQPDKMLAAIEEGRRIAADPNIKGYSSIEELKKSLEG
ncbi:MAG: type II toxin-antitoxin system RelB/DinJ family antitoxin [Elusimicrobiales bacterium]|nr:type II toxin-antitoxin system RelB/DinJ family antitoxin [Elusimicrobiales bacterium]